MSAAPACDAPVCALLQEAHPPRPRLQQIDGRRRRRAALSDCRRPAAGRQPRTQVSWGGGGVQRGGGAPTQTAGGARRTPRVDLEAVCNAW